MKTIKKIIPKFIKQGLGQIKGDLFRIVLILNQFFIDIIDIFYHQRLLLDLNDCSLLESHIRKKAHILEKEIKNLLQQQFDHESVYKNLKTYLEKWQDNGCPENKTIKWAKKIMKEYEKHRKFDWICKEIGKDNNKIPSTNILNLLKERRSIRKWKDESLNLSEIYQLIDAARWAPSSCNRQTLNFLIIDNKESICKIAETVRGGRTFFKNAPLLIMVLVDFRSYNLPMEKYTMYQDAAAAIQNMLLMAHNIRLGACWASYASDTGMIINERWVRSELNIPNYFKIAGIVAVGKPNEQVCHIPRKEIKDIVFVNSFNPTPSKRGLDKK
jgi:nitroreductase